jgi:hypothetical protein
MGDPKAHSTKSWKSYKSNITQSVSASNWFSRFCTDCLVFINKSYYKLLATIIVFTPNLVVLYIVNIIFLAILGVMRPFI